MEDNIRVELKEISINMRNWVDSAQDRDYLRALVNAALNLRLPLAMELVATQISHDAEMLTIRYTFNKLSPSEVSINPA